MKHKLMSVTLHVAESLESTVQVWMFLKTIFLSMGYFCTEHMPRLQPSIKQFWIFLNMVKAKKSLHLNAFLSVKLGIQNKLPNSLPLTFCINN